MVEMALLNISSVSEWLQKGGYFSQRMEMNDWICLHGRDIMKIKTMYFT